MKSFSDHFFLQGAWLYFLCTRLLYPSIDVIETDFLLCHLGFSQKARKCSMINKRGKDWPGLGYPNIKKKWWGLARTGRTLWSSLFLMLFHPSEPHHYGLKNIYFSQANPTHLVSVFFSKSPVLLSMSFREFSVNQCHSSSSWNGIWESAMSPLCPATGLVHLELSGTTCCGLLPLGPLSTLSPPTPTPTFTSSRPPHPGHG